METKRPSDLPQFENIGLPATLRSRVRAEIARTPAPTISNARARMVAALATVPVLTAAIVLIASEVVYGHAAMGLVVAAQSTSRLLLMFVLITALAIVSTLVALWRGSSGMGAGVVLLTLVAGCIAPIYAALVLPNPVHEAQAQMLVDISPWGTRCFAIAALVSTIALASFATALHRAVPVAGRLRGAALGAAAGAWAGLALFAFCPSGDQPHLLVGHVMPIVVFTLIGTLALSRVLRP